MSGDMEWVNGYTRKDGTVVDGFWRQRRNAGGGQADAAEKVSAGLAALRQRRAHQQDSPVDYAAHAEQLSRIDPDGYQRILHGAQADPEVTAAVRRHSEQRNVADVVRRYAPHAKAIEIHPATPDEDAELFVLDGEDNEIDIDDYGALFSDVNGALTTSKDHADPIRIDLARPNTGVRTNNCPDCGQFAGANHVCNPVMAAAHKPGATTEHPGLLERGIDDLKYLTAGPDREHYSEEDLQAAKEQCEHAGNRLSYLAARDRATATQRLEALGQEWRDAEREIQLTALDAIREQALAIDPRAAYFTLERSDQGPYMMAGSLFDASGEEIDVDTDQGWSRFSDVDGPGWLADGDGLPDYWSSQALPDHCRPGSATDSVYGGGRTFAIRTPGRGWRPKAAHDIKSGDRIYLRGSDETFTVGEVQRDRARKHLRLVDIDGRSRGYVRRNFAIDVQEAEQ